MMAYEDHGGETMETASNNSKYFLPIGCHYGYFIVLVSFAFFCYLQRLVKQYCTPECIDKAEHWKWKNVFLSWIHAIIIGIWVSSCFYFYPEMKDDLVGHHNLYTYSAVSFSTGYFLSDSFDLITSGQAFTMLPIAVHHIVVLWIFLYNITHCSCIGYTIVALIVELNSIFLHLRKLMRIAKFNQKQKHQLYWVNAVVNLLTIVICRFTALGWISYGIFSSYNNFSSLYLCLLISSIGVMWIIYIMAFYHLMVTDFLKKAEQSHCSGKQDSNCLISDCSMSNNNQHENFSEKSE